MGVPDHSAGQAPSSGRLLLDELQLCGSEWGAVASEYAFKTGEEEQEEPWPDSAQGTAVRRLLPCTSGTTGQGAPPPPPRRGTTHGPRHPTQQLWVGGRGAKGMSSGADAKQDLHAGPDGSPDSTSGIVAWTMSTCHLLLPSPRKCLLNVPCSEQWGQRALSPPPPPNCKNKPLAL